MRTNMQKKPQQSQSNGPTPQETCDMQECGKGEPCDMSADKMPQDSKKK